MERGKDKRGFFLSKKGQIQGDSTRVAHSEGQSTVGLETQKGGDQTLPALSREGLTDEESADEQSDGKSGNETIYLMFLINDPKNWRIPPKHSWYSGVNPGGALNIRNRQHQTTLTRFRTGHLKPLKIEKNNKIYPTAHCPKCSLVPAASEHILACIRCTKQDLWERPLLIIKQFEEHGICFSQMKTWTTIQTPGKPRANHQPTLFISSLEGLTGLNVVRWCLAGKDGGGKRRPYLGYTDEESDEQSDLNIPGNKRHKSSGYGRFFFFLIFIQQSYQPIKLVELVDELINGSVFFFFLISTQSITLSRAHQWMSQYQDFFLISTQQSYQPIKLVDLVDDVC
ncbi:hypothetical protein LAZ67_7003162 [Cordylochernes scorpioides]|uniref:Uncharacterized protein n=1 Tax=Cordylochernes scorpioides TaxID=51811 RepID=A0ABY6KNS5_9ARAC|nr:hypothetical protein LAZ67_7003162 [Cordylochernes scorpioides]